MKKLKSIWFDIVDNSIFAWLLLPLAIRNLVESFFAMRKQYKILQSVINENDDFATAIGTLGFAPDKFYNLTAIYPTDLEMTDQEIYDTANKQILLVVKNYLVDNMLLGIVKVEFKKLRGLRIKVDLQPAEKNLFFVDLRNLVYSIIFTTFIAAILMLVVK